jgi:hypothetical protein
VCVYLRGAQRLAVFDNRMLRRIFGPKWKEEIQGSCILRSFIICIRRHILLELCNRGNVMDRSQITHEENEKCSHNFCLKREGN